MVVAAWAWFLWQGIRDPLGGINSLWPLFGICNQLLATVALCVATTILVKMGRARYMWMTLAPLAWLIAVTFTASWAKMFNPNPLIGLLAHARLLAAQPVTADIARRIFNDRLDAAVCGGLIILVSMIVIESAHGLGERDHWKEVPRRQRSQPLLPPGIQRRKWRENRALTAKANIYHGGTETRRKAE